MTEPDQFALHSSVSPGRILGGHANHGLRDRRWGRGTSRPAMIRIIPPETSLRCQATIVAGVTEKTAAQRRRDTSRDKAASHTRSAGV
jgi:hypothetical protein